MRVYRLTMAAGMAVAACLALGCGSSGPSEPLTKADFIRKAEAICQRIDKEEEAAATSWKNEYPGGAARAEKHPDDGLRQVVIPAMRRKAEELGALSPPEKDAAEVARMIEHLSAASDQLEKGGFRVLSKSGALEFKQEAASYGLKSCGSTL